MKKTYLALGLLFVSPAFAAQDVEEVVPPKPAPKTEVEKLETTDKVEKPEAEKPKPQDEESKAQDEGERPKVPILPPGLGNKQQDNADKIVELFKDVDKKMKAIDELLFDIGAGEVPLALPKDSGLGDLLDLTRSASDDVVKDIDEILKIAEEMGKEQSKPGGKTSQKPGQSGQGKNQGKGKPKDKPGEQGEDGQPSKPEPKPGEEQGEGEEPKPGEDEKPGEDGKDPKSGQDSKEPGANKPGPEGSADATIGPGSKANLSERWGELPERTRETFRNQGGEDLPLFYRDWIESYYRHLNRTDGN